MINANSIIENVLSNFIVNDEEVAFAFLEYFGHGEPYIVYEEIHKIGAHAEENANAGYFSLYDFQIYSTGNYLPIIEELLSRLESAGFIYQPENDSSDMYDHDTKYYHKTICFAYPIQRQGNGGEGSNVEPIDDVTFPLPTN